MLCSELVGDHRQSEHQKPYFKDTQGTKKKYSLRKGSRRGTTGGSRTQGFFILPDILLSMAQWKSRSFRQSRQQVWTSLAGGKPAMPRVGVAVLARGGKGRRSQGPDHTRPSPPWQQFEVMENTQCQLWEKQQKEQTSPTVPGTPDRRVWNMWSGWMGMATEVPEQGSGSRHGSRAHSEALQKQMLTHGQAALRWQSTPHRGQHLLSRPILVTHRPTSLKVLTRRGHCLWRSSKQIQILRRKKKLAGCRGSHL